jgi:hypothetical protein
LISTITALKLDIFNRQGTETGFMIANAHYCSEHKAAASCLNAIEAVDTTASTAFKQLAAA